MVSLKTLSLLAALSVPAAGETVLLDFGADSCGPCRMMEPTVDRLQAAGYPVRKIDLGKNPQVGAPYGVVRIPCFIMLADGREVDRVTGPTTYARLEQMIQTAQRARVHRQTDDRAQKWPANEQPPTYVAAPKMHPRPIQPPTAPGGFRGGGKAFTILPLRKTDLRPESGKSRQIATGASVRLKIEDDRGSSYGSGTIIDVHEDEALVLTCGHIFRDSQGRGRIAVDLFVPGAKSPVPGRLEGYDLDRDVALVSIRPGVKVTPVKVAPVDYRIRLRDRVFSIGCDRGGEPRLHESRITGVNRYLGPANLEVAGQPVDGRSGGGLFSDEGYLIGVCNAADPADDEGLYAALSEVQKELKRAGLGYVYQQKQNAPSPAKDRFAAPDPSMIAKDRTLPPDARGGSTVDQAPLAVPDRSDDGANRLRRSEQDLVEAIRRRSGDAEVICIVRSGSQPHGRSDVIVLDRPSQALLDQLAREFRHQQVNTRHTTSFQTSQ